MIHLSAETQALAERLAAAKGTSLEDAVRLAIEGSARAAGLARPRRRMTAQQMLAVGEEIAALPLLDQRSAREIMDDLNAA